MTEQMKYRAKINAKGLDTTGVTEDHARGLASRLGSHVMLVCEARATKVIVDEDGNQQVALILTQVEPVPAAQDEVVRDFMRAIYRSHPVQEGQEVLQGVAPGPSIADAGTALGAHIDHDDSGPYMWDGNPDSPLAAPEAGEDVTTREAVSAHDIPRVESASAPAPENDVAEVQIPTPGTKRRGGAAGSPFQVVEGG